MPISTKELIIEGHEIKIVTFSAGRGLKTKVRLLKLILPALSLVFGENASLSKDTILSLLDKNIDPKALQTIAESLDPDSLLSTLLELLSGTFIDNKMITSKVFDEVFAEEYFLAYKIAVEVVKANNFLSLGGTGNKTAVVN